MGSPEIAASGRVRSSSFSLTCNRLSRYLKEKGSFGDIGLVLTPRHNMESKGTMNLLPMIDKSCDQQDEIHVKSDGREIKDEAAKKAQMTIFYGGRVMLFDDLPADTANEIIMLASEANASAARADKERGDYSLRPPLDSDLPIARNKSLSRFLAKRKDRVTANAPYPVVKADVSLLGFESYV